MTWLDDVKIKLKRKNQILFRKDCEFLEDLASLVEKQKRIVLVMWAFDLARESIKVLEEKYPQENRPRDALAYSKAWARGEIKMPIAQRKILDCHGFAKEIDNKEDIASVHAVGQACSVVHTAGHAMGYPIYDLTSIVHRYGIDDCFEFIESRKVEYIDKLNCWSKNKDIYNFTWADFLLK